MQPVVGFQVFTCIQIRNSLGGSSVLRKTENGEQYEEDYAKKKEELDEMRKSLELEKKKLEEIQKQYSGYKKNVVELAKKIGSMRPDESVQIMLRWEDTLVIDVLRQMDAEAAEAGTGSITSYLISLMPRDRASRIMYLMTQL